MIGRAPSDRNSQLLLSRSAFPCVQLLPAGAPAQPGPDARTLACRLDRAVRRSSCGLPGCFSCRGCSCRGTAERQRAAVCARTPARLAPRPSAAKRCGARPAVWQLGSPRVRTLLRCFPLAPQPVRAWRRYYYADVYVGTPPQRQTVIVDTGSSMTAFPCKGCLACGTHMDPKFDVDASSTAEYVSCKAHVPGGCSFCESDHCGYSLVSALVLLERAHGLTCAYASVQHYSEGSSLSGYKVRDVLWLGGHEEYRDAGDEYGVPFVFGCHKTEGGAVCRLARRCRCCLLIAAPCRCDRPVCQPEGRRHHGNEQLGCGRACRLLRRQRALTCLRVRQKPRSPTRCTRRASCRR